MSVHYPQRGDFALIDIRQPVGEMIHILQWLNGDGFQHYEHAAIYLGDGLFAEATPKHGIEINPITEYPADKIFWSTGIINPSPGQRAGIVYAARNYVGVDYSFLDYGALAAHRLHIWLPGLKSYIASTHHMICSQFVDQCYKDGGYTLFKDHRWPGYVTPGDLYQVLESLKEPQETLWRNPASAISIRRPARKLCYC